MKREKTIYIAREELEKINHLLNVEPEDEDSTTHHLTPNGV